MDISVYFEPADKDILNADYEFSKGMLGSIIKPYTGENFPSLENVHIAIIGVKEDRKSINNEGCALAPDYVRKYFYKLFSGGYDLKIADLGNIKRGFDVKDTYFAVSSVIEELIKNNILPVIIGGSQDITYANYLAYEQLGQIINIVTVDSHFDLGKEETKLNSHSYLSKIILHQPNFLFNYANIGYQTYFVDQDAIELMKKLYFDIYRLGDVRADMEEVEPIVRNADMLSIDISSIRKSDAPGNGNVSPNGFYGEEMCRIARYAGLSDKLSSIGFYELNPIHDKEEQTSHLVAQIIWYFIDGFYNRKHDFPLKDKSDYLQYRVNIQKNKYEIIFYKSKKSDRWWMEVPCTTDKYERHHLIPCSYTDYQTACREDMPDRWWQAYQKFS
ncbi:MAG: formimidoylglutamase [Bacteroidales bacterium]|jgi:arginase family enzyme